MPAILVRGRLAWILGMIVGVILIIVGAAAVRPPSVPLIVVGCAFFLFGLIFLILSFVTRRATD